jgi:hypothetical protein
MQWFTIVTSILTILAVPTLCGLLWKDLYTRKKENNDENRKMKEEKNLEKIRTVIKEENAPIREEIIKVNEAISALKEGNTTLLRDRMQCSVGFCKRQGYKTSTDLASWNEMYNSYQKLGGNHFKEYVNAWKEEMEELPTEEEYMRLYGKSTNTPTTRRRKETRNG